MESGGVKSFSNPETGATSAPRKTRRRWMPYLVLALSLIATAAATRFVQRTADQKDKARFDHETERTTLAIVNRIDHYTATLRNMVALFQAGGIPNRQQFHD